MKKINGKYKHFKGNEYEVFAICKDINGGQYVIYKPLYNDSGFWIRPFDMFFEKVNRDGITVDRFSLLEEIDNIIELEDISVKHSETLKEYKISTNDNGEFFVELD